MLLKNFKVNHQILNNAAKNLLPAVRLSNRGGPRGGPPHEWQKYNTRLTPKQYREKLEQCPKSSHEKIGCKKLNPTSPEPKPEVFTASDEYLKARQFLERRIDGMMKYVESESRSIVSDLKSRPEKSKAGREAQLEELFEKTTHKLNELMKLDNAYGCWMRKEILLINDEIKRSFDVLERSITLNTERIESKLKSLRNNVSGCVELAEKSVRACRKHETPSALAECVKERLEQATKMLDQMNEEALVKLKEIGKSRENVLTAYERTDGEMKEVNRKKATEVSEYLQRCIAHLKKLHKERKRCESEKRET